MAKQKSRPKRWADACANLSAALCDLREVHEEYVDWRDNLPENLEQSPVGEKLDEVADAGFLDEIESAISEAEDMDLPVGFGRD